jgi:hypothetical protein
MRFRPLLASPVFFLLALGCAATAQRPPLAPPHHAHARAPSHAPLRVENAQLHFFDSRASAIGLNYFDGFRRLLDDGTPENKRDGYVAGFRILAAYEIPFVRFAACGFYPDELRLYRDDPAAHFALLDGFVREAEKNGVGLVPSLFWAFFAVPDLVGEPIQAWGDAASQTRDFMRRYTQDVVTRYRASPAIWAWEFGNEYLLEADISTFNTADHWVRLHGMPPARTEADRLRSADAIAAYREFAELVRSLDPVRPITSGNTVPRTASWHIQRGLGWTPDSPEQSEEFIRDSNPDPNDLISVHVYWDFQDNGHYFPARRPIREQLEILQAIAARTHKPLWLGEFGADPKSSPEERRRQTEEFVALIEQTRVPLSALWVFDSLNPEIQVWNVTADNEHAYALTLLRDANRRLRASAPDTP